MIKKDKRITLMLGLESGFGLEFGWMGGGVRVEEDTGQGYEYDNARLG